jgi:hypothetical protein
MRVAPHQHITGAVAVDVFGKSSEEKTEGLICGGHRFVEDIVGRSRKLVVLRRSVRPAKRAADL